MKPFTRIAAVLFGIIALAHLYRIVRPFEVSIAGQMLPQWVSIAGLVVAGGLSLMLWREAHAAG
ncbi:MAG TPA: hypothetical protein VFS49_03565 [Croceibacterium sp.]|nr:hypothetical protein [Croceibacterium sp.]